MKEEIEVFYSVRDRYEKQNEKPIEAYLNRVTAYKRNGKLWKQEIEPIAYVYTHEFLNYKFWNVIQINKIIREAAERSEYFPLPPDRYWHSDDFLMSRFYRFLIFVIGFFVIFGWLLFYFGGT